MTARKRGPGGTTAVPKLIHDALFHAHLTGVQRDVCLCVARWTWGHRREQNLPNGNALGPAFIAAETGRSVDSVKKAIRELDRCGALLRPLAERGRRPASIKVQPDPRLWSGHVPDELLAGWTASVGLEGIDEAIERAATAQPVAGLKEPLGQSRRKASPRNEGQRGRVDPESELYRGILDPPQSKEMESPDGGNRPSLAGADASPAITTSTPLGHCPECDLDVRLEDSAKSIEYKTGSYYHRACWNSLAPEDRQRREWLHRHAPESGAVNVTAPWQASGRGSVTATGNRTRLAVASSLPPADATYAATDAQPDAVRPPAT
jgi:hypothetical protein